MLLTPDIIIRLAEPHEADGLTALAIRSKAHWGYDAAFMAACEVELRKDPRDCAAGRIWVATSGETILGLVLLREYGETAEIDDLWVDPPAMGRGIGRRLMEHALSVAKARGLSKVGLDADPNAEGFYRRMGFETVNSVLSKTWPDRLLPRMERAVG